MTGLSGLAGRVRLMVSRAVVALVDDTKQMQEVQLALLADEARAKVEHFQHYGFTSVPMEGAEAIALSLGGSRSHLVAMAIDDRRYRKRDLQPGEVALYTDEGDSIVLKRGRIVEVVAGTRLRVDAPEAEFTGSLHVKGAITCESDVSDANGSMQEMRDRYNSHKHSGVTAGASATAPPQPEMG